jgi:hypothetical protein
MASAWPAQRLETTAAAALAAGAHVERLTSYRDDCRARTKARLDAMAAALAAEPQGIPVSVYAERNGVSVPTVYAKIRDGLIVAVRHKGGMLVQA